MGMHVDDIAGLAANGVLDFLERRNFLRLSLADVEEAHARGRIDGQHGAGKAERRLEELAPRQLRLVRYGFHVVADLAAILARAEEAGAKMVRVAGAYLTFRDEPHEVVQDVEFHYVSSPIFVVYDFRVGGSCRLRNAQKLLFD